MIWIEFVEPDAEQSAETSEALAALGAGDADALAAVEAALSDLLAAAIPSDPPASGPPKPALPRLVKKTRRQIPRRRFTFRRLAALHIPWPRRSCR